MSATEALLDTCCIINLCAIHRPPGQLFAQFPFNWKVAKAPMYLADGTVCDTSAIIRQSDGAKLGEVGKVYTALQNEKAFDFFQPFVDSGEVTLETAGSLDGGKKIWRISYKP